MDCDEISADWAAQRIKGLNLSKALADGVRRALGLKRGGRRRQKFDQILSLSAPGTQHDVGRRRPQNL